MQLCPQICPCTSPAVLVWATLPYGCVLVQVAANVDSHSPANVIPLHRIIEHALDRFWVTIVPHSDQIFKVSNHCLQLVQCREPADSATPQHICTVWFGCHGLLGFSVWQPVPGTSLLVLACRTQCCFPLRCCLCIVLALAARGAEPITIAGSEAVPVWWQ